jgi:hypothetical protein
MYAIYIYMYIYIYEVFSLDLVRMESDLGIYTDVAATVLTAFGVSLPASASQCSVSCLPQAYVTLT